MQKEDNFWLEQVVPIVLTGVVFATLWGLLHLEILLLNRTVISRETIIPEIRWADVLLGMTIYLKTSIDFAIFIGRLMTQYRGWKNRIMIEVGTALGNALGTGAILLIWDLFREVKLLMAAMIILAALVLLRMAEDGLDHVKDQEGRYTFGLYGFVRIFEKSLSRVNRALAPILNKLIPHMGVKGEVKTYLGLLFLSCSVPFILGLDDFAGYLPLFNIVNVYGFSIGVIAGHMILNIFLFLSPRSTIRMVKNPVVSFIGSVAFVGLAGWGVVEAVKLLLLV